MYDIEPDLRLGTSHNLSWRGRGASIFFEWNVGGLKKPKDDPGGVFKFLLSSIPTKQHDAWVKDLILIQFYTKSYIV